MIKAKGISKRFPHYHIIMVICLTLTCWFPVYGDITVLPGYQVKEIVAGLDGPEGLTLIGAGQIVVCESQNVPWNSRTERLLTLVLPNGKTRTLAAAPTDFWVDVVRDPSRGYFVTQLGALSGIQHIHPNGKLGRFYPTRHTPTVNGYAIGIALHKETGDLYVSLSSWDIIKLDPQGNISIFQTNTRAEGMTVSEDGYLIAAVGSRTVGPQMFYKQVVSYDLATGAETVIADNLGTRFGFICTGKRGELFVSDASDGCIRRLRPDGSGNYDIDIFASGFSTSSVSYNDRSFNVVAYSPNGRLYVTDYGAGKLYVIF